MSLVLAALLVDLLRGMGAEDQALVHREQFSCLLNTNRLDS